MRVLFAASEANPIAKVGGLADVAGALPKALKKLGVDVRLVIPKYKPIETPARLPGSDVPVYFVESKEFFDRDKIYGYDDDPKRFAYFSEGLLELAKKENFEPDIVHINDYHTSLAAVLLKTKFGRDSFFAQTRTVLTLHNLSNQGIYDPKVLELVGLSGNSTPNLGWDTRDGDVDILLQGIAEADLITAVSPTYAKEILTPEYGEGLQDKLNSRRDRLHGILNGIDTEVYDPKVDANLHETYDAADPSPRTHNKKSLLGELKLSHPEWPLFGLVGRLVPQKGIDFITGVGSELGQLPLNLAILGAGDEKYVTNLKELEAGHRNVRFVDGFNEPLARRIYGSSDFFLVPSRFEPCGLTQMVAMRYGAIPIVRKTGGLADTVFEGKNGLLFEKSDPGALLEAIKRALKIYEDKGEVRKLQQAGMKTDFSWDKSAKEYVKLYEEALSLPRQLP